MARSFTVSFNINGSLDGSLQAALKAAANAMRGLGNAAKNASAVAAASKSGLASMAAGLNQLQAAAQRYKQIQDALKQSSTDFALARQKISAAKTQYEADAAAVDRLKAKLAELQKTQAKLGTDKSSGNATLKQLRQDLANLKKAYADAKKAGDAMKMSTLGAQIKSTQGAITAQQASVKAMAQAYRELSAQVKQTKSELSAANAAAQKSGSDLSAARSNMQRLTQNYQSQISALRGLQASLSAAGFSTSGFAAAESRLAADIDRVNAALQRQQALTNAQRQSSQASQEMFNAYNNFQSALNTASTIAQPFKTATEKAVEFERVMSEVKALTQMDTIKAGRTDVIEKEMSALTAQAKELGATTIYTAQQVGEAQAYIARTGWTANQILASTPSFLKLAASGHMDMARTADIATNIMTGFGISAEKAQHVCDVLAYTTTHSNQNLEEMGEAMKYAAPVAKMFGASLEETAAMTTFMADAGIKGSMAGTSMRQTMLRLVAPPKKATKAMQEFGLTVDDANAAWQNANAVAKEYGVTLDETLTPGRQMLSIVKQIDKQMAGASNHEKMAALSAITGVNAVSGAMNVFGAGAKALDEFTTALENCDGALEQTYGVMTANTYGALKSMESAWEAIQLSVGQALSPAVERAANAITPMMTAFSQFIDAHPEIVQAAAAIAAALASLVVGAAAVKLAFAGWNFITSSILLVRTALATLADGALLGGLIARLAALRTALLGLTAAGGLATFGGWATMFAAISAKATVAAVAIRTFFASLTLGSMASGIAATISSIGTAIAGAARAAMSFAFSPVGVALMALALAGLYCYQNWDKVSAAFGKIAGVITGALSPAITQIQTALNALSSSGGFAALSNAASQAASVIGGTLVKAFAVVLTVAASAIATIIQLLADLVTIIADIGTGLSDAIGKISEGDFSGAFDALTSAGSKAFADLKQMGNHVFDGVEQGAKNVQSVIDALNSNATVAIQTAQNTGSGMATGLLQAAQVPQAASAPETQPIDTSATQAALDQVGDSASNAASQMQSMQQATAGVDQMATQFAAAGTGVGQLATSAQQAGTGVQQFSTNAQQAGTSAQQMATSAQNAASGTDALGNSAQNATSGIEALSASAAGAVGGVSNLGSAASSAAGSVSGLGAAVQSACAALASAGASAAAAVASAGGGVKANYRGGIYPKGQFLTTFAEKSPEAAIPIDNSKRARDLWTKTGQMLGMLPGNGGGYDSAEKDAYGNIVGMDIPEYNKIGEGDTEDVKIDKRRVQREQYERERAKREIIQPPKIDVPEIPAPQVEQSNQSVIQQQAIEITRAARENYLRRRLTPTSERILRARSANNVRLPSGYTIGDALKYLPQQKSPAPLATQPILSQERTSDNFIDTLKNVFGNVGVLDEIGGKLGEALKILPTLKPREVPQQGDISATIDKFPVTTPPFAPTQEKSSGFSLTDITKIFPNFKGNIGGFDILGGLTGGNIFGSFGALDGLGGKFPKQGKSPFGLPRISLGSFFNGLGKVGNFGTGSTKIGNVNNAPMVTTPPFLPKEEKSSGGLKTVLQNVLPYIPNFKGNIGGFDILGGLTGGNIFGSFGALDGKFGGLLNKLGSVGNFGALGDLGGGVSEIGGLSDLPILNSTAPQNPASSEFHVTINVTVNGNADENTGRRVAEQVVPALDDWARNWQDHQHELARKSFA